MRVRQAAPPVNPAISALANDGRSINRTSAHSAKTQVPVNRSSRHPSTAHVMFSYSIAISARAARDDGGAEKIRAEDRQQRSDRGCEADGGVLAVERPQRRARRGEKQRFADVRLVERRHLAAVLQVADRIAADVRVALDAETDARGTKGTGQRRHVARHYARPRRVIERAVLLREGVEE